MFRKSAKMSTGSIADPQNFKRCREETEREVDIREMEFLLIETRLLFCRQILNQIKRSTFDSDSKVANDKYCNKIDNDDVETRDDIPGEDEISNKFITSQINMVAMNVCGLRGKEKTIESTLNRLDVRICVMTETWLVGKEKPDMGRSYSSFFTNRSEKANKGGIAIVIEKSVAQDTVVIGRSQKGDDLEWLGVRINSHKLPEILASRNRNKISAT